jgi:hypothetical protein
MKLKKLLILLTVLSLWGGTMIFADAASQKVKVVVNGSNLGDTGMLSDGQTFLPLRQVANKLQALVTWDEDAKKATINKPNVHMFLFKDKTIFGKVNQGTTTFSVFAQVDSLNVDISAIKIVIADPKGNEDLIGSQKITTQKDNFWFRTEEIKYNFNSAGNYDIRFYVKPSSDDWTLVSEKQVIAD